MIISRTPYRISLFGGGTDFPSWYHRHGGSVVAAAINKYCYISARYLPPFFEHKHRIVWSKIELCNTISSIEHPAVRAVLNHIGVERGVEIHHVGDLPARSGIGSSSSFTVGLLKAVYALRGKMINKHDLALEAIHLEQEIMRENVGSQDQVSAAYGGLNHIHFHQSGEVSVVPLTIPVARIRELESHLMLFYTGISRTSSEVQQEFIDHIDSKKRQLRILNDLTEEAIEILNSSRDIAEIGLLLEEAWDAKKGFSKRVTNSVVDALYAEALAAGAVSGKITGAGGGGFLMLFVPPERQSAVRNALSRFTYVPFLFDFTGSQIMMASQDIDPPVSTMGRGYEPVEDFKPLGQAITIEREVRKAPQPAVPQKTDYDPNFEPSY